MNLINILIVEEAGVIVKKRETVPVTSGKQLQTQRKRIGCLRNKSNHHG